jgi:transcriptional regulator with XRE-family HTH domain
LAGIALRKDKLEELRPLRGLVKDADLARAIGVNQSSLMRVLHGTNGPSTKFIAGLLDVAGGAKWFETLFIVIPDPK